jgi:CHAD domain-containing protein
MVEDEDLTTAGRLAAYVKKQLKRFEKNLAAAREGGDVDAVHDIRVASRRLAEPLRLMGQWMGRKSLMSERKRLKKARGALRKVRDLDVLQKALMESSAGGILEPNDLAQVEGVLTQKREKALCRARRKWEQFSIKKLVAGISDHADRFGGVVREGLDEAVAEHVRRLFRERAERLLARDPRRPESGDLHQTRICAKRLRYAAELMRDTQVQTDQELIDILAKMQERLGHWNDDLVAARTVAKIACRTATLVEQPGWSARVLSYATDRARSAEAGRRSILDEWPSVENTLRRSLAHSETRATPDTTTVETTA